MASDADFLCSFTLEGYYLGNRTLAALSLHLLLRVVRRWNQTGQKFAGNSDIASAFLPRHTTLLWTCVTVTYILTIHSTVLHWPGNASNRVAKAILLTLFSLSLIFKISFTYIDAPELLQTFPRVIGGAVNTVPLVMQARGVFLGIGISFLYAIVCHWRTQRGTDSSQNTGQGRSGEHWK